MKTVKIKNIDRTFYIAELKELNVKAFGTNEIANEFIKNNNLIANVAVLHTFFGDLIVLDMGDHEYFVSLY